MIDETALNIFTDGSCCPNPGKGGTGMRFVTVDEFGMEQYEDFPGIGYTDASNQKMELQACIDALNVVIRRGKSWVFPFSKIIIRTDSMYVVENLSNAKFKWNSNDWIRSSGAPVLNAQQWKELVRLIQKIYNQLWKRVEIKWVKGHAKSPHNKAVDKTAKSVAGVKTLNRASVSKVRRKKFAGVKTVTGSVQMQGQRISIYIISEEYLPVQKLTKFRYQVVSKKSPSFQHIDFAYSDLYLRSGHTYSVRLNKDQKNPRIAKLFREVIEE